MGSTIYSSVSRKSYVEGVSTKSKDAIFFQNKLQTVHDLMEPMSLGIRESRDSEVHPESIAVIIALDVTGSMGSIPERIVRNDLTHIMETLIGSGLPHLQIMFVAIGDHISDSAPLQVGQFESGDQELAMWLERTYLEGHGGGSAQESYPLAWLVGGKHTSIDCMEKRSQKGFLFTIGDEGFHKEYDPKPITGEPSQKPYSAKELYDLAAEKYHIYHIHANYTSYRNNQHILSQWKELLGDKVILAENDAEIAMKIADTIRKVLKLKAPSAKTKLPSDPAPDTSEKPDLML